MNWTPLYLDTFIPEYPKILNGNFASVSRYVDIFYDGSLGILTKPLTTTGRVKGARGEFVTVVVDNLIVKNQFTNLFDNNTTADYNFYKLYIDPAVTPRDPCTAVDFWPKEVAGWNYIDVNKPYYKIQNLTAPIVFSNNNLSQVVGIFLDPSLVSPTEQFKVILDPHYPYQYFTADASAVGDPSAGTGFYVEFIATAYDPSYGTTWSQYKHGLPVVGTGGGGGGSVGPGTPNYLAMFGLPTTITDSPLSISGTTLYTDAINVNGLITLSNFRVTGVASPITGADAVNRNYTDQFSTNSSVNTALGQFVKSASAGNGLYWVGNKLDVSLSTTGADIAYVDGSLATRDSSIIWLFNNKVNNASLGLYYTKTQIDASFAKYSTTLQMNSALGLRDTSILWLDANKANNASLGLYATNASVNLALGSYATNSSVNAAGFTNKTYVDTSLATRDSSITWLYNNTLTITALNPYATNASIGLAGFLKNIDISSFATNASVGLAITPFATNSSVGIALAQFIRSTSTGYGLFWNAGLLDVSIVGGSGPSFAYVDGSLSTRDSSIIWLFANKLAASDLPSFLAPYATIAFVNNNFATNVSVNNALYNYYTSSQVDNLLLGYITQSYVDGSLALQQLQINSLDNRVTILESSTGNCTFAYVDGSLAVRDSSITFLFNNLFLTEASLATLTSRHNITEVSLGLITLSLGSYATNASIAIAGFATNASLNSYCTNASANIAFGQNAGAHATFNSQINGLLSKNAAQDASIIRMDSSITWLMQQTAGEVSKIYVDGSLAARDYQIDLIWANMVDFPYVDGSLDNIRANYIPSASTGIGLYWNAGYLDVSVAAGVSKEYIDGSIAALNASVNAAGFATNASVNAANFATNASIGTFKTNYIDPSLGAKFNTAGGLITGGVQIGTIGTPVDVCIYSTLYVSGHTHVGGNLTVDGSLVYTNVASLDVSTVYIKLNTGQVGVPDPGLQSGIIVQRGSYDPYIFVFDQNTTTFRVGVSFQETSTHYNDSSTQAVATREDVPVSNGIMHWDSSYFRTDTHAGFVYDEFLGLNVPTNVSIGGTTYTKNIEATPNATGKFSINTQSIPASGNVVFLAVKGSDTGLGGYGTGPNGIAELIVNATGRLRASNTGVYINGDVSISGDIFVNGMDASTSSNVVYYKPNGQLTYGAAPAGVTSLSALTDVSIVTITDKNLLQYDSGSGKWRNVSMADASNYFWSISTPLLREASLNMSTFKWNAGLLEPSVATGGGGVSQTYVDGSLATRDGSINKLFSQDITINASLGAFATNASIGLAGFATNASIGLAGFATNASIGLAGFATNASVNTSLAQFVKSASTRNGLSWNAGYLDVSMNINSLTDVSIVSLADKSFLQYDTASSKWKNVSSLDASAYFQLKIAKNTVPGTGSTGNAGDWSYDASYLYLCTSTNKWGRLLLDYGF